MHTKFSYLAPTINDVQGSQELLASVVAIGQQTCVNRSGLMNINRKMVSDQQLFRDLPDLNSNLISCALILHYFLLGKSS